MSGSQADQRVIWLLLFSTFVVILNETIMGVAIPHLMHDMHITANAAQWLTTAFLLTMATVIPVTGFLLQRLATRPVFVLAMVCFSAGTLMVFAVLAWMATLTEHTPFALLVAAHVILSVGLALTFTPLFTASLGSLPKDLYAHGSAMVGTVQQVAGAAGAALMVALMTRQAERLAAGGAPAALATVGGIRDAFVWGAAIAALAVVAAFFVRKPAPAAP